MPAMRTERLGPMLQCLAIIVMLLPLPLAAQQPEPRAGEVAVDDLGRQAVRDSSVCRRVGDRGHRRDRGVFHVEVVLADEQHWELPDGGQIQRLMESADVGGPIAEEGNRNLLRAAELCRPRGTGGDRQMRPDDRVRAEHPLVGFGEVHGAALGLAQAGRLAH